MDLPIQPDLAPMEARTEGEVPDGPGWQFEPKWDGFRCLAYRDGDAVRLLSKSGQGLERYFPDIVEAIAAVPCRQFVLDGEIVLRVGGVPAFGELQLRLHPAASRVRTLVERHRAEFQAFDLLALEGRSLVSCPLSERRPALEAFLAKPNAGILLSPTSRDREDALRWLAGVGEGTDGVIAKRLDAPYDAGGREAMIKVKRIRTADCVVGGFRYASAAPLVGSLLLGLYDEAGLLDHVGFTSGFKGIDRRALTKRLEALSGGAGFTGKAPGGPSRWSTERSAEWTPLRPELVVEVAYDHVTDRRFRHGTRLLRERPDKAPAQCRMEQILAPAAAQADSGSAGSIRMGAKTS